METLINPEEVNRVITDRISTLLMCCTATGVGNLQKEGISFGVHNPGDLMYDAVCYYNRLLSEHAAQDLLDFNGQLVKLPKQYYLLTCHREENTGTDAPLTQIFTAMQQLDAPVIYSVHPRNRARAVKLKEGGRFSNVLLIQPVGYLTSLYLISRCKKTVTDSGGLQREAWFFDKPCITLLKNPLWAETFDGMMNQICSPISSEILEKLAVVPDFSKKVNQFGDGHAAEKITQLISNYKGL